MSLSDFIKKRPHLVWYTKNYDNLKAERIFSSEFNEKLFRVQLAYFKDIDYTEKVIYMKGFKVADEIIKKKLIEFSLE